MDNKQVNTICGRSATPNNFVVVFSHYFYILSLSFVYCYLHIFSDSEHVKTCPKIFYVGSKSYSTAHISYPGQWEISKICDLKRHVQKYAEKWPVGEVHIFLQPGTVKIQDSFLWTLYCRCSKCFQLFMRIRIELLNFQWNLDIGSEFRPDLDNTAQWKCYRSWFLKFAPSPTQIYISWDVDYRYYVSYYLFTQSDLNVSFSFFSISIIVSWAKSLWKPVLNFCLPVLFFVTRYLELKQLFMH